MTSFFKKLTTSAAALSSALGIIKPDTNLQAQPRAGQTNALNYMSVQTLDPTRLASAFAQADQGYIYEQAAFFELIEEHDPHIFAEMSKRRRGVTGLGWKLEAPQDATEAELSRIKELTDMLKSIKGFEDAQYDLTDAIGKGFAALEYDWQTGSHWVPKAINWVPQRMFQIDRTTGDLQYLNMGMPEPLRPMGWIVHQHRAKSGYMEQAALYRILAWTYAYKAYNVQDMQRFLEKYGLPLRLGKYPAGLGKPDRDALFRAVSSLGYDGAGVIPSNMSIEFVQATKTGTVTDFMSAIEYWERKQSLAILGGTLTSQADGKTSTNALGMIHDKVRREIMLHDVRQLEPTLTEQLVHPIASLNGMFNADRMPRFAYDTAESIDQQLMVNIMSTAANMGMKIDVEYAHKVLQIPKAEANADVLIGAPAADQTKAGKPLAGLSALSQNTAKPADKPADILHAFIAQLSARAAPLEQDLVQKISALIAESGDYETALAAIEALAIQYPATSVAEQLALGMAAANLAGRASVV